MFTCYFNMIRFCDYSLQNSNNDVTLNENKIMKKKYCPDTEQKNSYLNFTPTNRLLRELWWRQKIICLSFFPVLYIQSTTTYNSVQGKLRDNNKILIFSLLSIDNIIIVWRCGYFMGAFYITPYSNSTKCKETAHSHIKAIMKGQGPGISPGNYEHDTWLLS